MTAEVTEIDGEIEAMHPQQAWCVLSVDQRRCPLKRGDRPLAVAHLLTGECLVEQDMGGAGRVPSLRKRLVEQRERLREAPLVTAERGLQVEQPRRVEDAGIGRGARFPEQPRLDKRLLGPAEIARHPPRVAEEGPDEPLEPHAPELAPAHVLGDVARELGELQGPGGIVGRRPRALLAQELGERPAPVLLAPFDQDEAVAGRIGLEALPERRSLGASVTSLRDGAHSGERRNRRPEGLPGHGDRPTGDPPSLAWGELEGWSRGRLGDLRDLQAEGLQPEEGRVDRLGSKPHRRDKPLELLAREVQVAVLVVGEPFLRNPEGARAACRLANARRLDGDHAGAEQALGDATALSDDNAAQAELCRALALLRWEQGRNDEAAALLDRSALLWAEEEVTYEESACRVLRALLVVEEGAAKDAVGPLRNEKPLLVDTWLTLYASLALALGLAERGIGAKARTERDQGRDLVRRSPLAAHLYALRLQGELALRLDELAAAEALFNELRFAALEGRFLPEAAVATLAQAYLDVLRGIDREPAQERAAALAATFGGVEALDEVLGMLREYPYQLPKGTTLEDFTAALMGGLPRILRLHGARSAPLPFV
jgi:hypothetical protein